MQVFCQDRDLLGIEPVVFIGGGIASQQLISGVAGAVSGTTFSSTGSNFNTAKVESGMVLCVHQGNPAEASAYEVISVESATALKVSVLRADPTSDAVPPPARQTCYFGIRTFKPQICCVSDALAERLRRITESGGVEAAEFVDSFQLRLTTAYGALAAIFMGLTEKTASGDVNHAKAEHYHKLFIQQQLGLRLAVDIDGDGVAEQTRTLGNVSLRRV